MHLNFVLGADVMPARLPPTKNALGAELQNRGAVFDIDASCLWPVSAGLAALSLLDAGFQE